MKRKNLAQILKKYPEQWVSITENYQKVIASGKTLKHVTSQLAKMGNPKGVLMYVADDYSQYAGFNYISFN